jgi:hypothetical protein
MNATVNPWRAQQSGQHMAGGPPTGNVGNVGKVYSLIFSDKLVFPKRTSENQPALQRQRSKTFPTLPTFPTSASFRHDGCEDGVAVGGRHP